MDTSSPDKPADRLEATPTSTECGGSTLTEIKPRKAEKCSKGSKTNKSKKIKEKGSKMKNKSFKAEKDASSDDDSSSSDSSDDSSDDDDEETSSDSSDDSEDDSQKKKRKIKEKKAQRKAKEQKKKAKKGKEKAKRDVRTRDNLPALGHHRLTNQQSSSESDSSDSEEGASDGEENENQPPPPPPPMDFLQQFQQELNLQPIQSQPMPHSWTPIQLGFPQPGMPQNNMGQNPQEALRQFMAGLAAGTRATQMGQVPPPVEVTIDSKSKKDKRGSKDKPVKGKRASKLEFKRVDQLWDSTIHDYKLTDTVEDDESSEYDQYLFNVRRTFDFDGKYQTTVVDIKSKLLKEVLNDIMGGVKGVSLVEENPNVDPNLLFLYLEDIRDSMKELKKKLKSSEKMKKKLRKKNESKVNHTKVLLKYLDKDYAKTKKALYPMLESGLITFDLLWAIFKPGQIAVTTTYGSIDEPRAFKVELTEKEYSFMRGQWYNIEGRYLEYDGKTWGMGTMDCDVSQFKGARKINSLACYPLKYHKDEDKLRKELIERGKKFVSLQGVHYKSHEGLAYVKRKRQIIKVNINGRIMVDAAIHRRILPNYQISTVKPKDQDEMEDEDDGDSDGGCCGDDSGDENQEQELEEVEHHSESESEEDDSKRKLQELDGKEGDEKEDDKKALPVFTDEEYLIASPVVLGFAFAEKLWLEFTVSGIKDIVWNDGAYESLVLEKGTKEIVKALVESHKYHPAESIDDVIQGKGKGLVAVLHGPPGTGKTLTAEGISELLKCPLYMVSAGELGTDPRTLEGELQKILDIAHAWGAVLLLDEADVFLEKRTIQDIHRNALVSIFLRLLEYFQGILFLTTNRVETFDDAFQSRIHIALRYGELSVKAKKSVFKAFIERVRLLEGVATMPFTEEDYDNLAKNNLNGRQIKNTVRTAQALAVNQREPLGMQHIRQVLDVLLRFDRDLKGGTGYEDAMRSYY